MRIFTFLLLITLPSLARPDVEVTTWARATPPGASSAAIYGAFRNNESNEMRVAEIRFEGARHVMIHRTVEEGGMARMVHGEIRLRPGELDELKPGGLHVMLMGISSPLLQGCRYPFEILWENGDVTNHQFLTGSFGQMTLPAEAGVLGNAERASCP